MGIQDLFEQSVKVINIGLIDFFETMEKCGVESRHVELARDEEIKIIEERNDTQ